MTWSTPYLGAIVAVLGLVALGLGLRGRVGRSAVLETLLGAAAWAGLALAAAGPRIETTWTEPVPPRSVMLVDASASMGVGDAQREVESLLLRLPTFDEVHHFDGGLHAGLPTQRTGRETDLATALTQLRDRLGSERLASLVVVTDGRDRGALRAMVEDGGAGPTLPGPLTVYLVGDGPPAVDLAVDRVDSPGFAYAQTPVSVVAHLRGSGFEGAKVPVTLLRDGAVVATATAELDAQGRGSVTLTMTPSRAGREVLTVAVPDMAGDALPSNNRSALVLRTVRDRMRVLQVAGAPSWDVKFLRRFLKGDPSVDLVCFYILRTREDDLGAWEPDDLSLIEFPYEDLFDAQLDTFDVVILHNFDPEPYFRDGTTPLLENLAQWVRAGGGLVMVGGDRSMGLAGYGETPLADVLPVALPSPSVQPWEAAFAPALTAEGARHPLTRLVADPVENERFWSRLPPLDGMNAVGAPAAGAAVLLGHPGREGEGGGPAPVLAVREVGQGRTMTLAVDSSWRWSVTEAAAGRGNQAYLRFWKNAVRWLLRDPALSRVALDAHSDDVRVGEVAHVVALARDPGFEPMAGAEVVVTWEGPTGTGSQVGVTDSGGTFVAEIPVEAVGSWRVMAKVSSTEGPVGTAELQLAATDRLPELDQLGADRPLMEAWVTRNEGRLARATDGVDPLRDDRAVRFRNVRDIERLDRGGLIPWAIAGAFGAAWWLRRRAGAR